MEMETANPVRLCVNKRRAMDRDTPLNNEVFVQLGFQVHEDVWLHSEEPNFAIKIEDSCFYISYHEYFAQHRYELRVGVLEKQFYERTGGLLF